MIPTACPVARIASLCMFTRRDSYPVPVLWSRGDPSHQTSYSVPLGYCAKNLTPYRGPVVRFTLTVRIGNDVMLIFTFLKRLTAVHVEAFWKMPFTTKEFFVVLAWKFGLAIHPL